MFLLHQLVHNHSKKKKRNRGAEAQTFANTVLKTISFPSLSFFLPPSLSLTTRKLVSYPRTQSGSVGQSAWRRRDSSSRRTSRRVRGPECHSANRVPVLLLTPLPFPLALARETTPRTRSRYARASISTRERERERERRRESGELPSSPSPRVQCLEARWAPSTRELSTLSRPEPREPLLSSPSSLDPPLTLSSSFDSIPSSYIVAALPAFRPRSIIARACIKNRGRFKK